MKIKGAIFDFDGTLIDSLGFWKIFYRRVGEHFFGDPAFAVDAADDRAMRTQSVYFLANLMYEKYGVAESAEALHRWFIDLVTWYYDEVVEPKVGAREFLSYLKQNSVKMIVATASESKDVCRVLRRHGLLEYFEGVISCTEAGAGKDKPDVFFAAEKLLGTPHEETWIVEDSALAIETAKKAGFFTVGVYDANGVEQARSKKLSDIFLDDGASFIDLIPQLEA